MGDKINSRLVAAAEFNAGVVAEGRGNLRDALRRYRMSLDIRLDNGQDALAVDSLAGLLRAYVSAGDVDGIQVTTSRIRSRLDMQGLDGVEHVGRLFLGLISASQSQNDHDCVREFTHQGVAFINERAARLADPAHRASYLNGAPAHRVLRKLASELGTPTRCTESG